MCGIAGIYHLDKSNCDDNIVPNMLKGIQHRGPDDEGMWGVDHVRLGFVRLSIIDLSPAGHQPMLSDDGRYVITFNGEIFNYIEIRKELQSLGVEFRTATDTEVLLKAYIQWGSGALNRFNGMWAFCIYDKMEDRLFFARDRFGVKPLYYLKKGVEFFWCSEIPPLLAHLPGPPNPNNQAIFDFLVFNRTDLDESTFFEGIYRLNHGCYMQIDSSGVKSENWYDLRNAISKAKAFASPEEFLELFESSLQLRLRSDVPVGVCLSGGIDSSSIASTLTQRLGFSELNTFSAVYNPDELGDETPFIKAMEGRVNKMHFIRPTADTLIKDLHGFILAHAEPIPSTGPYAQYKVMELASEHVVVTLDGQGADEELAGYHYFYGFYFKELMHKGKIGKLFYEMAANFLQHRSFFALKSFFYFLLPERLRTSVKSDSQEYLRPHFRESYQRSSKVADRVHGSSNLNEALIDHFEYKLEHLLKWEDRNSMRFSIEARVPFLDYRLVERLLATPASSKIRNGITKYILRQAMKGILPEKIRMRKDKTGFLTPQDDWFRTSEWNNFILSIFESDAFGNRGIINEDIAIELYKKHLHGEINASREIWKLVHLELWFRNFIDPYKK